MRGLQQNAREDQGAYPERQGRFLHVGGDESRQRLVFREQILEDDSILNSYELVKDCEQEPREDADESIPNSYNLVDLAVRPRSIPIPTIQLIIRSSERHSDNVFQRLLHMWGRG